MTSYAAIDLHSNTGVLTVIDDNDKVLTQRKLPNEIHAFVRELEPFRATLKAVAVESTFNWYWLVDGLIQHDFPAMLVNTTAIQQYQGLKHADDKYDAWWIAHMMRLGILPTGYIYPPGERAIRDLLRKRATLVQQRTANILSIQNLEHRNHGQKMSVSEVRKLSSARIHELYASEHLALALTVTVNVMNALTEQIKSLEKAVLRQAKLRPEWEMLRTVWGIGEILSLTIMYEAGNMSRFTAVGDFVSYARCVKAVHTSNGKKKADNNGKNGNRYLAWAFVEAAHFAIRAYPEVRRYYDRKTARTNAIVATKAIANKLARASFHVLTDRTPFDPKRVFG